MATVIHEEGPEVVHHERVVEPVDSGMGTVLAVIVAIILVALFLFYGLPFLRNTANSNVPDTIDVNLNVPGPSPTPAPGPAY